MGDGDGLEAHVLGHTREELGVLEGILHLGGEGGDRVTVGKAVDAKFHGEGAAHPLGVVKAGVLLGVGVQLGRRDRDVIMLVGDCEAKPDLGWVWEGLLGECGGGFREHPSWVSPGLVRLHGGLVCIWG